MFTKPLSKEEAANVDPVKCIAAIGSRVRDRDTDTRNAIIALASTYIYYKIGRLDKWEQSADMAPSRKKGEERLKEIFDGFLMVEGEVPKQNFQVGNASILLVENQLRESMIKFRN